MGLYFYQIFHFSTKHLLFYQFPHYSHFSWRGGVLVYCICIYIYFYIYIRGGYIYARQKWNRNGLYFRATNNIDHVTEGARLSAHFSNFLKNARPPGERAGEGFFEKK